MRILECMNRDAWLIDVDATCGRALELMKRSGRDFLLVQDDERLVGIVTRNDIQRRIPRDRRIRDSEAAARPLLPYVRVSGLMTYNPVVVSPEASVEEGAALMRRGGFRKLPVVADGKVVGFVTAGDLLSRIVTHRWNAPSEAR